ncbi:MAG: xanthine dehydrogenase family protein molybdopterin-binding subunit [Candidatus Binataceae bacterium]|nr:xanthine dehydrogenase family protein molybdopterin-binding subunit [Candidatus Binataceae bacterium]
MTQSTIKSEFTVIGTRPIRHDGIDKVTGRARYGADIALPGMLHGAVLRSPHAHARIRSIDMAKARRHPGVKAVVTGADFPEVKGVMAQVGELIVNTHYLSLNVMARGKVLYDGHAVAAVAATSRHVALEALELIEVDYEVLTPVMTAEEAMKPDAPVLLEELRTKLMAHRTDPGSAEGPDRPTNVPGHIRFERGDLAAGFRAAAHIVEREFVTAAVHQGYIEPQNALAIYGADGHVTIHCSTQGSFNVRTLTSSVLGIPEGSIRVVPAEIGGGFGGKTTVYLEPVATILSKLSGRPVKMVMSRADVLRATGPTSGTKMKVRMGAARDGTITAAEVWLAYEAGAFPGSPFAPGAMCTMAPYNVANLRIDSFDVVVNRPKVAAYRAPGSPASAFACETVIDELATLCGIDPLDFRILNGVREGMPQPAGPPYKRIGFIETCTAMRESAHYQARLEGPNRGRGVAAGFWFNGGLQSSATVNIHGDGSVSVVTGSVDIGGSRTTQAMIAAEVLGADINDVRPVVTDTDSIGHTDVTGGSRVALATGMAVYEAAHDALAQLKARAAKLWEKPIAEVRFAAGTFSAAGNGVPPMTLKQLATRLARTGGPIVGRATLNAGAVGAVGNAFAVACVDVEIDPETAKVRILRCSIAQDVGRALHPGYVEGQMQGALAQGIGWALSEEYFYDRNGLLRNAGLLDYRMPTCLDLPMIETVIVEVPNPHHPLGVRGVGEVGIVPPMAAVANAIYQAIGVRMTELPMSPPHLLKAIGQRGGVTLDSHAAAAD